MKSSSSIVKGLCLIFLVVIGLSPSLCEAREPSVLKKARQTSGPQFKEHEGHFTQRLNWDNPSDSRTFQQRYFENSEFASGDDAPVIFYIGAEVAVTGREFSYYYLGQVARDLKAHWVSLEHRYYGLSQPFPTAMTNADMKYLNLNSILSDIAAFQKYYTKLHHLTGKWVVWSGSYGGQLSAYYRQKYPDLAVGAVSSSGSVQIFGAANSQDTIAADAAGVDCVRAFRSKVITPIEQSLNNPEQMKNWKTQFAVDATTDDFEFLTQVGYLGDYVVQESGAKALCDSVSASNAGADAFIKVATDLLKGYSDTFNGWMSQSFANTKTSLYTTGESQRPWNYQICTELGGWVGHGSDPDHALMSLIPNDDQVEASVCKRAYGLTHLPAFASLVRKYYDPLLDPNQASNILFVNGSDDPVLSFSISPLNHNATNSNLVYATIEGGTHCEDMVLPKPTDSQSLTQVRQFELDTIRKWVQ